MAQQVAIDALSSPNGGSSSAPNCSICLNSILENEGRGVAKLQCNHTFHLDCIGSEFNAKRAMRCPNCRRTEQGSWLYAQGIDLNLPLPTDHHQHMPYDQFLALAGHPLTLPRRMNMAMDLFRNNGGGHHRHHQVPDPYNSPNHVMIEFSRGAFIRAQRVVLQPANLNRPSMDHHQQQRGGGRGQGRPNNNNGGDEQMLGDGESSTYHDDIELIVLDD